MLLINLLNREILIMLNKRRLSSCVAVIAIVIAINTLIGCNFAEQAQDDLPSQANFVAIAELSPEQQAQKDLAIEAKDKLFQSLLGELTESMGKHGPAKSIAVCKTRAPEIATSIGKEAGVQIGRTSFKLRNDSNTAPEWASTFVNSKIEQPVEVALANDGLGVLLPIRLKATCTLCHGTAEQVQPDVKAALISNYPNDTATGFAEGDLRGYFWIEVPSANLNTN